jgi:uncharacterized protein (TIGR02996 family)
MITTERDGLLADILEHPEDDTPRLILADWLEEHGESERAAFIRYWLQHPRKTLRDIVAGKESWWDPAGDDRLRYELVVPDGCTHASWRRGFVAEVSISMALWLELGPSLVQQHPIEAVQINGREPREQDHEFYWYCYIAGQSRAWDEPRDLLEPIFRCLQHGVVREDVGERFAFYTSVEMAKSDLSEACLRYAREMKPAG